MLIRKDAFTGFIGVAEVLMEHGIEHYEEFKRIWKIKQKPPHLVIEGTIDNPKVTLRRPEELSIKEQFNAIISITQFDNAAELYLKAFMLQNNCIINTPKNSKLKFTDELESIFTNMTINFNKVLSSSEEFIRDTKRKEFSEGFQKMHKIRNELYHVGGMGEPFTIQQNLFEIFLKSLKVLFEEANWYKDKDSKTILVKLEKSLSSSWI